MSTLRTTITLDSNNLFPTPLSIKSTNTENIDGNSSSFVTNDLQPSGNEIILSTEEALGNSGILYLYCQSASTNSDFGIDIYLTRNSDDENIFHVARLLSGTSMFLPIYAADSSGITINVKNNDPVNPATVQYFFGSKD